MTAEERCDLINRLCTWVDGEVGYQVDKYGPFASKIAVGLVYTCWAIADRHASEPFDASMPDAKEYEKYLDVLRSNPDNLLADLIDGGFLVVPDDYHVLRY